MGEHYKGKITHTDKDGTYTVYLQNIEKVIIKDHKGNEIDPADLSSSLEQDVANTINEATFGNAAGENEATLENLVAAQEITAVNIVDAYPMLDQVKTTLNESGIESELRTMSTTIRMQMMI